MALLKAKQLNINDITQNVLNAFSGAYSLKFNNLVESVNTFSTGYNFPTPVINVIVTFVNANSVTLQWDTEPLAISYTVYLRPKSDILDNIVVSSITNTFVTISGLAQDTIYEYYVSCNLSFY